MHGYALGRLARALATSQHDDPQTRARAEKNADSWLRTLEGMFSGLLAVGSRTPVKDVPGWATPQVLHGGFATGHLLAGGEWQPHELALLDRLGLSHKGRDRSLLNSYFVSEEGFAELRAMLASGCYRVEVPEEAALLVVAWLSEHGGTGEARALLDELLPFFKRLRFYPIPAARPLDDSGLVCVEPVGAVRERLLKISVAADFARMRLAIQVLLPCYDRVVALFQETVEDGWPCQRYPEGWKERGRQLLQEADELRLVHGWRGRRTFRALLALLRMGVDDPACLSGRDVGFIRAALAAIEAKRGLPGSSRLQSLRQEQLDEISRPTKADWAKELAARLEWADPESGLEDPSVYLAGLPESLAPVLNRSRLGRLEDLVSTGIVGSSEVVAELLPGLTARVNATEFGDGHLSRLYVSIYRAFRKRRTLLLLNLESQIDLRELPWVKALEPYRSGDEVTRGAARRLLEEVVALVLGRWPEVIVPNRLLRELRVVIAQAGLDLPMVEEVAADIFMGDFSEKFLRAARLAGKLLKDSLYARYYAIDYSELDSIQVVRPDKGAPSCPGFARLCRNRAGLNGERRGWSSVGENGRVIEQEQILTTHNLAALYSVAGSSLDLEGMCRHCFRFVYDSLEKQPPDRHTGLILRKQAAYAWRQMVFFLSLQSAKDQGRFLRWAKASGRARDLLQGLEQGVPFLGWVSDVRVAPTAQPTS